MTSLTKIMASMAVFSRNSNQDPFLINQPMCYLLDVLFPLKFYLGKNSICPHSVHVMSRYRSQDISTINMEKRRKVCYKEHLRRLYSIKD